MVVHPNILLTRHLRAPLDDEREEIRNGGAGAPFCVFARQAVVRRDFGARATPILLSADRIGQRLNEGSSVDRHDLVSRMDTDPSKKARPLSVIHQTLDHG